MDKAFTAVLVLSGLVAGCGSQEPAGGGGASGGSHSGGVSATGGSAGATSSGTGGVISSGGTSQGGVSSGASGAATLTGGANSSSGGAQNQGQGGSSGAALGGSSSSGGARTGGSGGMAGSGTAGSGGSPNAGAGGTSTGGSGGGGSGGMAGGECKAPSGPPTQQLITFNDNGGWCWYQDERVVVDTKNNRLIVGSMASGGNRNGNVEAVVYDLAAKSGKTSVLNTLSCDDHNAPAFVITGAGTVAAMWATHRENCNTYFATLDGAAWSATKTYSWSGDGCPWTGASTNMVTYANPWLMSAENNRIYSGVRSVDTSPNFLSSTDNGASWKYQGRLTASPQTGYVAGYYKYWGNGSDRIDWVGTEAHPRDADNSLWHGYVQGGKVYNSSGAVIDDNVSDKSAQNVDKYSAIFKTGTTIGGVKLEHLWNHDIVRYTDGTIAVLGQGRVAGTGSDDPDKRMIYSRFDGKTWTTTYLVKAGTKLYPDEQDYTGLSALHPDDPNVIFVSTPFDPRDDKTKLGKREIWQGTTCDGGKTFTWTPVTQNSSEDNIRPVVPKWDASHTALLWMKGTYNTAQKYTMKIVGLILQK